MTISNSKLTLNGAKLMMSKLTIFFFVFTFSYLSSAAQKCDDTGCYDTCTDNSGCSAPNGCYEMSAEDFEGSSWNPIAGGRKENGEHCTTDNACKSANCERKCDEYKTDDNGNTTSECKKDHQECTDLKVCRKGQSGETLGDTSRLCDNGLIIVNNKCVTASSIPFAEDGTDSSITEVTVNPISCAMKVPAEMNARYRYNIYMTQLLEFLFESPQFGGDADCLGVTKGITHIVENLKKGRQQYSQGIIQGLKEQEDKFYQDLQNHSDVTKKDSVDMYMQSLKVMLENQKKYKEQNSKMQLTFQSSKDDFTQIQEYFTTGWDWRSDATGDTPNRTKNYTLSDGWHAGVRDGVGENYCRGRSPRMKNAWKRRYHQGGTPGDLGVYLNLPIPPNNDSEWNKFWDSVGDEIKNNPSELLFSGGALLVTRVATDAVINGYKAQLYVLDPVLPSLGTSDDYFSKFGKTDWANNLDGDVRQDLDGGDTHAEKSVNGMLDFYVGALYRKFKEDPTVLGKINSADKPKIEAISALVSDPKWAANYFSPGLLKEEVNETDATKKYFINKTDGKYFIHQNLRKFLDVVILYKFSPESLKHVVNFHKLIWDFRQRMYLIQYYYSATGGRRHDVQLRGTFFDIFNELLQYNVDYLTALNKGHDDTVKCLENLKISYQAAVAPDGTLINPTTNYDPKSVPGKTLVGQLTQHQNACIGDKCKESAVTANLNIPTFQTKAGNNSNSGQFKEGNLKNSSMSAFEQSLKAIAATRKKNAESFLKTASPLSKKAVARNRHFVQMALTIPAVVSSVLNSPASLSSSTNTEENTAQDKQTKGDKTKSPNFPNTAVTPTKPPVKGSVINFNSQLNTEETSQADKSALPQDLSDALLIESKKDDYKPEESDSIFTKISKGYMRAGLPRLLKKQANINPEHEEFKLDKPKKAN